MTKKSFLFAFKQIFLMPLLFVVFYAVIFMIRKEATLQEFNALVNEIPSLVRFGSSAISVVTEYFPRFGALAGVAFGLVQLLLALILYLIVKLVGLSKWKLTVPLVLLLSLLPLAFFGHNMVFVSNRFTAISSGIILFVGYPLFYTSLVVGLLLAVILLFGFLKKVKGEKMMMIGLMLGASMMLSGCDFLGWLIGWSCDYSSDDVHCYQEVAVNSGESDECEKVPQKEGFTTSNPPKDKCYMMIAENTGDPTACNDIKGGAYSYTRAECLENVFANGRPEDCEGRPNEQECRDMYAQHLGVQPETDQEEQGQEQEEEQEEKEEQEAECGKKDFYCLSTTMLQTCTEDGQIDYETCLYGCADKHCLSEEEKTEKDEEDEKKEACKEGISSCLTEYTLERCLAGQKVPEKCEYGCDKSACRTVPKKNCTGLQRLNPFCSEADDDIEDKMETDITTIKDAATGQYMDMLQEAIDGETDPSKRRGLEAYQQFLNQAGEKMEEMQTTIDDLKNIKRIFLDAYDPSMDIQNMDVDKVLKPGLFDRIKTSIFGGPKTEAGIEMAEAEDGLAVYEVMLQRQSEIDFLKQSRLQRLGQVATDKVKGDMADKLKEKTTDIAADIAGDAMIAVEVVDYALTSFVDEAKKQSFVGLVRAYNRRRKVLQEANPNMNEEELHVLTVQQVKEDPYRDAKGRTFIKYGNILENEDCQKGTGNQLCIDHRVFWTAMDKTYRHTHEKELHQRYQDQLNREFEEYGF